MHKDTQENDHNGNDNIDNVVNVFVSDDEDSMKHETHDGFEPINEGVTKDVDLDNLSLLYEDTILKWNYIALHRMLSRRDLTFEVDVQLLEKVIVKDNESIERALMCVDVLSDNMVEHVVNHMQSDLELSLR